MSEIFIYFELVILLAEHVFIKVVSYGIKDKHCGNVDIKLKLNSEVDD